MKINTILAILLIASAGQAAAMIKPLTQKIVGGAALVTWGGFCTVCAHQFIEGMKSRPGLQEYRDDMERIEKIRRMEKVTVSNSTTHSSQHLIKKNKKAI